MKHITMRKTFSVILAIALALANISLVAFASAGS